MAIVDAFQPQPNVDVGRMARRAREASEFLKALAHESRLMILCDLLHGEKSVSELEGAAREAPVDGVAAIGEAEARGPRLGAPGRQDDLLQHRQRQGAVDHWRAL